MHLARSILLLAALTFTVVECCGCGKSASDPALAKPAEQGDQVAKYNGRLDGFVDGTIVGWAYDYNHRDQPVTVVILDGEKLLGEVAADKPRQDLADKKIGTGKHGFAFPIPDNLRDGKPHEIHARIKSSTYELQDSPRKRIIP
jgi:hypothetical protein